MEIWLILGIVFASILALVLASVVIVQCCVYKRNRKSRKLNGQVILITGGTGGIGEMFWKDAYANGATVVFTGRSKNKVEKLIKNMILKDKENRSKFVPTTIKNLINGIWRDTGNFESPNLFYYKLDQSSLRQCKEFCEMFKQRFDKLDILFLNAGLYVASEKRTEEGLEYTMGVNHYSHFLIASELFPLIKAAPKSRIISTSSSASYKIGSLDPKIDLDDLEWKKSKKFSKYDPNHRYGSSKFANVVFTNGLSAFIAKEGINSKAVCLHPGVIRTGFFDNLTNPFLKCLVMCTSCYLRSQEMGAQTGLHLIHSEFNELKGSKFYDNCSVGRMNPDAAVESYYKRFWDVSIDVLEDKGFNCSNFSKFGSGLPLLSSTSN